MFFQNTFCTHFFVDLMFTNNAKFNQYNNVRLWKHYLLLYKCVFSDTT
jgi:hypothetical protein